MPRTDRLPARKTCNYCRQAPAVWIKYTYQYSRWGNAKTGTITCAACAEHDGCPNWLGILALHPTAIVHRM